MNKKGSFALAAVAIILALVVLGVFLVNIAMRDCNSNKDCSDNAYCGSDYECHEYPKQIVAKESNYLSAAIVVGVSLILAAYVFKRN